jgi:histidinol-phosphate aminotransferase
MEFTQRFEQIPTYPAAQTYASKQELVKLASNENPWPPHPSVCEAISKRLTGLHRYPDPDNTLLRQRIAAHYDLFQDQVAVGNGSCEILLAAAEVMLEPGTELIYSWPAFSMYPHLNAMTGARAQTVALDAAQRHDLPAMASRITDATRIIIVCNPNNPTATAVSLSELDAFVGQVPSRICVIVDEAYVEFSGFQTPRDSLVLLHKYPNVVLLRTFSKIYGLAGLRVGYALASERFRDAVDRVRQPFSVNQLAESAASEAILHQGEVTSRAQQTATERDYLKQALDGRGYLTTDSQANFAWVDLDGRDETQVLSALSEQGVLVRGGSGLGQPGWLRVTYGDRKQNDRFLNALDHATATVA